MDPGDGMSTELRDKKRRYGWEKNVLPYYPLSIWKQDVGSGRLLFISANVMILDRHLDLGMILFCSVSD